MNNQALTVRQLQDRIAQLEQENSELRTEYLLNDEKLNAVLDVTAIKIWQLDVEKQELHVFNAPWGQLLGHCPSGYAPTVAAWKENIHPEDRDEVVSALEQHLAGNTDVFDVVHRMIRKDGSICWIADKGRVVERDAQGRALRMIGAHKDVTQEKNYELHLSMLANRDSLTGLLNRKALQEAFDDLKPDPFNLAGLLFIDLDYFKTVNDRYGHKFGDSVLCSIAKVFSECSTTGAFVSRFGGDEFVILQNAIDLDTLTKMANGLITLFSQPFIIEGKEVQLGLSIGVCLFEVGTLSFDEICERADQAMYSVKKTGENKLAFWIQEQGRWCLQTVSCC